MYLNTSMAKKACPTSVIVVWGLGLIICCGCQSTRRLFTPEYCREAVLSAPTSSFPHDSSLSLDSPEPVGAVVSEECPWPLQGSAGQRAVQFLHLGETLAAANDERSVDYFFQASVLGWQAMTEQAEPVCPKSPHWTTYQASLRGLLDAAARHGRLDGFRGLRVYQPDGPVDVPLIGVGGSWPVDQFRKFQFASWQQWPRLKCHYVSPGLGVPVVLIRQRPEPASEWPMEKFFPNRTPVSATFLLCPREPTAELEPASPMTDFVLELTNPIKVDSVWVGGEIVPLARDLSAAFEYQLAQQPNDPLAGFLTPSRVDEDGLRLLEPYEPGKIPVIFVHGLNSDPTVWSAMVNHLRAQPWFNQRYQVWGFNYATGSPFVTSALRLRQQLCEAIAMFDPQAQDLALRRIVLIGHSMGGLVSKLQVTESGDAMWNSVSRVPLESLQASAEDKQELIERLYFSPQPFVRRVVYIATPHAGSSLAARGIGRISSALVREDESLQRRHDMLVRNNPDAFTYPFRRRIPTSIDLLEPNDPTLRAIYSLPVAPHVSQHNILGTGATALTLRRGDGVVLVNSASHPDAVSEHHVAAGHTGILDEVDTTAEVTRILLLHLKESGVAPVALQSN